MSRQPDGHWKLRPTAKPVFRFIGSDPRCLGGMPGKWREFYRDRSPSEFGFEPDLAVMYWDQQTRRGRAASANMLRDILGDGWKEMLRQIRHEKLTAGQE